MSIITHIATGLERSFSLSIIVPPPTHPHPAFEKCNALRGIYTDKYGMSQVKDIEENILIDKFHILWQISHFLLFVKALHFRSMLPIYNLKTLICITKIYHRR